MIKSRVAIAAMSRKHAAGLQQWASRHARQLRHLSIGVLVLGVAVSWWADQVAKNIRHPDESRWTNDNGPQPPRLKLLAQGAGNDPGPANAGTTDQSGKLLLDLTADVAQLKAGTREPGDGDGEQYRQLSAELARLIDAQRRAQQDAEAVAGQLKGEIGQARQSMREEGEKIVRGIAEQLAEEKSAQQQVSNSMHGALRDFSAKIAELTRISEQQQSRAEETAREVAKIQEALRQATADIGKFAQDLAAWRIIYTDAVELSARKTNEALADIRQASMQTERKLQALRTELASATADGQTAQTQATSGRGPINEKMANATPWLRDAPSIDGPGPDVPGQAHAAPVKEDQTPRLAPSRLPDKTVPQEAGSPDLGLLMSRARRLIEQGNIAMARMLLAHVAETGHATALFALAETYDPSVLAVWGTIATQGDRTKAQELYAKALAAGISEAKERLDAVK